MMRVSDPLCPLSLRGYLATLLLVLVLPLPAQTPSAHGLPPHSPTAEAAEPSVPPLLALKTNLLLDAALTPNVEVEFPLRDNRWSVMAECWFPWYVWHHNSRAYQLLYFGAEGRRWWGDRRQRGALEGHFTGFYVGGGKYDLEWDSEGYQGEFYLTAGLSYGYSMRLNRRLRLEFSLGIGYFQTNYRHYIGMENDTFLVWQNNGTYNWFGPTKAKISLAWLLPLKKGGRP